MNSTELANFISNNRTTARLVYPDVGYGVGGYPAFRAIASGNKMAWVGAPSEVYKTFIRDIIPTGDRVRVVCDAAFPVQAIDFKKVDPSDQQALAAWLHEHDAYDDAADSRDLDRELHEHLAAVPDYPDDDPKVPAKFVRWSEFDPEFGEQIPFGVILRNPDGSLASMSFPRYSGEEKRWLNWKDTPADILDRLPAKAGHVVFISVPESIKADSWEDAPLRALHKFGADYFAETGRSAFS